MFRINLLLFLITNFLPRSNFSVPLQHMKSKSSVQRIWCLAQQLAWAFSLLGFHLVSFWGAFTVLCSTEAASDAKGKVKTLTRAAAWVSGACSSISAGISQLSPLHPQSLADWLQLALPPGTEMRQHWSYQINSSSLELMWSSAWAITPPSASLFCACSLAAPSHTAPPNFPSFQTVNNNFNVSFHPRRFKVCFPDCTFRN